MGLKIRDLPPELIKPGLRFKSLTNPDTKRGTLISIDPSDDDYCLYYWDGDIYPHSGWYGNDCDCEVVFNVLDDPEYIDIPDAIKHFTIRNNSLNKYAPLFNGTNSPIEWEWKDSFPKPGSY